MKPEILVLATGEQLQITEIRYIKHPISQLMYIYASLPNQKVIEIKETNVIAVLYSDNGQETPQQTETVKDKHNILKNMME